MTETTSPAAATVAAELAEAGHTVHRCHEESGGTLGVAVRGAPCPVETQPIDVVVSVRPVMDDGIQCSVRRKIPLADGVDGVGPALAAPLLDHSAAATDALWASLRVAGVRADAASATVRRRNGGLVVRATVTPEPGRAAAQAASVRMAAAVREVDPWARSIDVSVVEGEPVA